MRPSIPRSLRAIAIATGLTLVLTSVAVGWTQLRNNYPGSPVSCTDVNPWYCIEAKDGQQPQHHRRGLLRLVR
jgi:hypothetical protein